MPFVADDLGSWLISALAEAGRKKLTTLVLGTDQQRALRSAATAAVQFTAEQLRPDDQEQAEHVARVISEVFSEPVPYAQFAWRETVLEALRAGIAGQLAVLDDADLTGTGQSSADVLGIPAETLVTNLTAHLFREIIVRGARGGPLEPLANQLNHDMTHLQGQRLEGKLDRLATDLGARGSGGSVDSSTWLDSHAAVAERLRQEPGRPTGLQYNFARLERKLEGHTNYVWDVIVTPDGRRVISASNDRTAAQWDLSIGKRLCTYEGSRSEVCSIAISSDGAKVIGGCLDGEVFVWDETVS
jgi:WD domain, G-beta repeat